MFHAAPYQPFGEDDLWLNRVKKKELFLDDVACGTILPSRIPTGLENSLASAAKGKRSERDRESKAHYKDSFKNGPAKIGRPPISGGGVKGERKNKSKPKLKMAQLSASVNVEGGSRKKRPSNDGDSIDLTNLRLPDIDVGDFGGQGQGIASWLNFENEGLPEYGD